jgi:hypothetical protein
MDTVKTKQEFAEDADFPTGPEGLLSDIEIPDGFKREDWLALTGVRFIVLFCTIC